MSVALNSNELFLTTPLSQSDCVVFFGILLFLQGVLTYVMAETSYRELHLTRSNEAPCDVIWGCGRFLRTTLLQGGGLFSFWDLLTGQGRRFCQKKCF